MPSIVCRRDIDPHAFSQTLLTTRATSSRHFQRPTPHQTITYLGQKKSRWKYSQRTQEVSLDMATNPANWSHRKSSNSLSQFIARVAVLTHKIRRDLCYLTDSHTLHSLRYDDCCKGAISPNDQTTQNLDFNTSVPGLYGQVPKPPSMPRSALEKTNPSRRRRALKIA